MSPNRWILLVGALAGLTFLTVYAPTRYFARYLLWRISATAPSASTYVDVKGTRLYVETVGSGPPLLLLHGGLLTLDSYFAQLPELSRRFRVIALETRGHGRSETGTREFSYALFAADAAAVLDAFEVDRADVVGFSDGANTGLLLALRHPARVGRLALISPNLDLGGLTQAAQRQLGAGPTEGAPWLARAAYWLRAREYDWAAMWDRITTLWRAGPKIGMRDLAAISSKVLIVTGENDSIRLDHTEQLSDAIRRSRLVIIPGAPHASLMTHPAEINSVLLSFLMEGP